MANLLLENKFIGRTYIGNTIDLSDKLELPPGKVNDYFVVNTKSPENMSIVCELLLVVKELHKIPKPAKKEELKNQGNDENKEENKQK